MGPQPFPAATIEVPRVPRQYRVPLNRNSHTNLDRLPRVVAYSRQVRYAPGVIPLGTDRPLRSVTVTTYALIAVNVGIFCVTAAINLRGGEEQELQNFAAWGATPGMPARDWWRLLSYQFVHADLLHLLGNMLFLWVFGPSVEDRFGRFGMLVFYLAAGAFAAWADIATTRAPTPAELLALNVIGLPQGPPMVGASASIAGVTGAYMVMFPRTHIKVLWLLIVIGIFEIPALWFIAAGILWDVIGLGESSSNIAHFGHLAGYVFGILTAFVLLGTRLLPREDWDLFYALRQARRRREMRAAVEAAKRAQRAARPDPAREAASRALQEQRATLSAALASNDPSAIAGAYRALLERAGTEAASAVFSRGAQLDLANGLFAAGQHDLAASAYCGFSQVYRSDRETPHVRLMEALVRGRYLSQLSASRAIIEAICPALDGDDAVLADELLKETGPVPQIPADPGAAPTPPGA